jgi:hypothetical protein
MPSKNKVLEFYKEELKVFLEALAQALPQNLE